MEHTNRIPSPLAGEGWGGGLAVSIGPRWFAACGMQLRDDERAAAGSYFAALDLRPVPVEGVADWREAAATAQRADWSRDWWQAEERERIALYRAATASLGESALLARLGTAMDLTAAAIQEAASAALARAGIADEMLARVAAGAASQACHQRVLAEAAGRGADHGFMVKYQLYRGGRWLLGVVGGRCFVF
jgi:hypothetical protein